MSRLILGIRSCFPGFYRLLNTLASFPLSTIFCVVRIPALTIVLIILEVCNAVLQRHVRIVNGEYPLLQSELTIHDRVNLVFYLDKLSGYFLLHELVERVHGLPHVSRILTTSTSLSLQLVFQYLPVLLILLFQLADPIQQRRVGNKGGCCCSGRHRVGRGRSAAWYVIARLMATFTNCAR